MPNHVTSIIEFKDVSPEVMEEVFNRYNNAIEAKAGLTHDGSVRFRLIGEEYNFGFLDLKTMIFSRRGVEDVTFIPDGYVVDIEQACDQFPDFEKILPPPENIFRGDLSREDKENCLSKGIPNWYDWNCENWGTKWNSYSNEKLAWNKFKFQTAWNAVPQLIEYISKEFPNATIIYTYADEDSGYNTGRYMFYNGEVMSKHTPVGGSNEAYKLYLEINPDCTYIQCIDGVYQCVEEN